MNAPGSLIAQPGDVYWVDIPKAHTKGHELYENRPYVIISRVEVNRRGTLLGVPFNSVKEPERMSTLPPWWITVPTGAISLEASAHYNQGKLSIAKADQARVLAAERLGTKIGTVTVNVLLAIRAALTYVIEENP